MLLLDHAKQIGKLEVLMKYLLSNLNARYRLGDLGIDGRIVV
jgi:hypothetical protein